MKALLRSGLFALAIVALAVPANAGALIDGLVAYTFGDYATALKFLQPLAEQGDAKAQKYLGLMYEKGLGVPQDGAEAVKWYPKAAEQGHRPSKFKLGRMNAGPFVDGWVAYHRGDYAAAVKFWRPLAEQGDADAQYNLGVMYHRGRGVPKDDTEVVKWYNKAAEQGDAYEQYNLGVMYHHGQGFPKDHAEAAKWWRKAAEQRLRGSRFRRGCTLCRIYEKGWIVPQANAEAAKWFGMVAYQRGDYATALNFWRPLAEQGDVRKITPDQIAEAQRIARDLLAEHRQ